MQFPGLEGKSASFLPLKNLSGSAGKVCRINLQPCHVLRVIVESLSALFGIQQIGCQNCSSAYQRQVSRRAIYVIPQRIILWQKEPFSFQGSDLLLIPGNYPLIFLKNTAIYHKDWHQHRLQTWLQ